MRCPECNGDGTVLLDQLAGEDNTGSTFDLRNEPCPACEGTGEVLDDPMLADLANKRAEA